MPQSHVQLGFGPRHGQGGFLPAGEGRIRLPVVV